MTYNHSFLFFFFNDTATTEIYTLSLHDALPISIPAGPGEHHLHGHGGLDGLVPAGGRPQGEALGAAPCTRSEEHTFELQSQSNLVCRLLLEKKKKICQTQDHIHAHAILFSS